MAEIKETNIMDRVPVLKNVASIMIQLMKKKHFAQVENLAIQWGEDMPEHKVLGRVVTEGADYVLFYVGPNLYKLWLTDYLSIALGLEDQNEEWFKGKRQLSRELPQIFRD